MTWKLRTDVVMVKKKNSLKGKVMIIIAHSRNYNHVFLKVDKGCMKKYMIICCTYN